MLWAFICAFVHKREGFIDLGRWVDIVFHIAMQWWLLFVQPFHSWPRCEVDETSKRGIEANELLVAFEQSAWTRSQRQDRLRVRGTRL